MVGAGADRSVRTVVAWLVCAVVCTGLAVADESESLPDARPFVSIQAGYAEAHGDFEGGPLFRCIGGFMLDPADIFLGFRYLRVDNEEDGLARGRLDLPMYFIGADISTTIFVFQPYVGVAGALAMPSHRIDSRIAEDLENEGTRLEEELDGGFGWIGLAGCRIPLVGRIGIDLGIEYLSFSTRVTTTLTDVPLDEIVGRTEKQIGLSHSIAAAGLWITL
jgi:hypothetical protein